MKLGLAERVLASLLAAGLLFFGGYFVGKSDERQDQQVREKKALEASVELHVQRAEAGQRVELSSAQREEKTAVIFNGISHQVIDYAQKHALDLDCRLDDSGLRLWNAANAGATAPEASAGHAALSAAAPGAKRGTDGAVGQPHRGGEALPRVPGSSPGADRLAGGH